VIKSQIGLRGTLTSNDPQKALNINHSVSRINSRTNHISQEISR